MILQFYVKVYIRKPSCQNPFGTGKAVFLYIAENFYVGKHFSRALLFFADSHIPFEQNYFMEYFPEVISSTLKALYTML